MAENHRSAEHELLRAIEGKTSLVSRDKSGIDDAKEKLTVAFEDFKKKLSQIDLKKSFSLSEANRIMTVIAVILVLFQAGILVKGFFRIFNMPKFDAAQALKATGEIRVINFPLKEYAYYLDAFTGRNIFLEKKEEAVVAEEVSAPQAEDVSKNLRLTGISWSEETGEKFAMIEDVEIKVTYYLQEKEKVRGFTIMTIGNNKVVLEKDGREIELR
jgi:type II secretory pathway component PulC